MNNFKVDAAIGAIRLLRVNARYRLLRIGEFLEEGDLIELLSPISSVTFKKESHIQSFEGVRKLKIKSGEIVDITAQAVREKKPETKEDDNKIYEFVEEIPFDFGAYLSSKISPFDLQHVVDKKILLLDVPHYVEFYEDGALKEPDAGCLIFDMDAKVSIKKFDETVGFTISTYLVHEAKISQNVSYPKNYKLLKIDEDGFCVIKKDLSLEFVVEI